MRASPYLDLSGQKYGRLTVLEEVPVPKARFNYKYWRCRCECGTIKVIAGEKLKAGRTKSCGCITKELLLKRNLIHGECFRENMTAEYSTWKSMRQRCLNPNNKDYKHYGGRGITICERWLNSFELFVKDVGRRPSDKHSIDRINNEGNYEPGNCRWATASQQVNNRRNNND